MTEAAGFEVAALDFYEDLENDNTRSFWLAHKQTYDDLVRSPMLTLAEALEPEFGAAKIFRPHRDVRFSKDKAPYKTHQGMYVATADATGYYLQIDAAGLMTGAGWYAADSDARQRFREAVDHRRHGAALQRILDALESEGFEIAGDRVKTKPRGWDADHPRIDLLRHNTLTVRREHGCPDWLSSPRIVEHVRADWHAFSPLLEWHAAHAAQG